MSKSRCDSSKKTKRVQVVRNAPFIVQLLMQERRFTFMSCLGQAVVWSPPHQIDAMNRIESVAAPIDELERSQRHNLAGLLTLAS